jgi:hypothetical protein
MSPFVLSNQLSVGTIAEVQKAQAAEIELPYKRINDFRRDPSFSCPFWRARKLFSVAATAGLKTKELRKL